MPNIHKLLPDVELEFIIFQQDGAACHTAKTVKEWFREHEMPLL